MNVLWWLTLHPYRYDPDRQSSKRQRLRQWIVLFFRLVFFFLELVCPWVIVAARRQMNAFQWMTHIFHSMIIYTNIQFLHNVAHVLKLNKHENVKTQFVALYFAACLSLLVVCHQPHSHSHSHNSAIIHHAANERC